MAVSNGELPKATYGEVIFGKNYPEDDNIYCMMCMHQSDCIKVNKVGN